MEKKSREIVQRESLEAFKANPTHRGTICLSTGTGKSKVAIDFIKESQWIVNVLITSPRTNLQENWRNELEKWGLYQDTEMENVWWFSDRGSKRPIEITIENIQTAYKWKDKTFDLIIADEIHTMMTPEYSLLFKNVEYECLMGLTATHDISDKNDKEHYYTMYAPIIYEYYDSADDGLINKTRFIIVNHTLSDVNTFVIPTKRGNWKRGEKEYYDYLTDLMKKGQQLMLKEGSQDWFNDARAWFWEGKGTPEQKVAALKYLNAIRYRKDYLLNLPSNVTLVKLIKSGILATNPKSKVLIFSELTDQANKITSNTVHSHKSKITNSTLLDDFNEGRIRDLGSCQSLTLGLNLKGATHAIMESYIGSETKSKQKKGRLDRLATDDVAEMWIIKVVGTQADKWFDEMTKGFDLSNAEVVDSSVIFGGRYDYGKYQLGR